MDHWDASVIRQLTAQRHAEDIARGLAAQRLSVGPSSRSVTAPRRAARLIAAALLAATLALGIAAPASAEPAPAGATPFRVDICYAPRHGGPALAFARCLPRPLPVPPGQVAI